MKGIINFESIWRRSLKALGVYSKWLIWKQRNMPDAKMKKMIRLYSNFVSKGDLCFDIGANIGSRVATFMVLEARVIALEPQAKVSEELRRNFKNDPVTVLTKGAGSVNEVKDFYVADDSLLSSFSQEFIDGQKNSHFKNNDWSKVEKVEIATLDSLIAEFGTPQFVKIDTEGFELEVLKGLSTQLKALSFEYTLPHQAAQAADCIHVIDKLYNGNVEYNMSRDEAYAFSFPKWVNSAEILNLVQGSSFNKDNFGLYGDIYARKTTN